MTVPLFLFFIFFSPFDQHVGDDIHLFADGNRVIRIEGVEIVDKDTVVLYGIEIFPNG